MGVREHPSYSIAVSVYYLPNVAVLLLPRMVQVKLQPAQLKFFRNKVHKGLVRKYEGPFPILGKVPYRVQLPSWLRMNPLFHVSCRKRLIIPTLKIKQGMCRRGQSPHMHPLRSESTSSWRIE